jgi:hypothetical protein
VNLKKTQSLNLSILGGAALLAFASQAFAEGANPLSLTLSEVVTHDSNLTRTTTPSSDTVSQTEAKLSLDKPYGRQNYTAMGRFGIGRYKNNEQFNNHNYNLSAGLSSEVASNWSFSLNGDAGENLNASTNNPVNARYEKNIVSTRGLGFSAQYGVSGRWALVGSAGLDHLSYSGTAQRYQNRDQNSQGLRLVYMTSDLLNFGLGASRAESKYPNLFGEFGGDVITQKSIDLSTNWQVTGFSVLQGTVSLVRNEYESDSDANFRGVTSRVSWAFTPKGVTSYNLAFTRTTDSDGSGTFGRTGSIYVFSAAGGSVNVPFPEDRTYNNITTSLVGDARWAPTAKLSFTATAAWYHYKVRLREFVRSQDFTTNASNTASDFTQLSLAANYGFSRYLGFGCSVQKYKQTQDVTKYAYDGNAVNCAANLTIN